MGVNIELIYSDIAVYILTSPCTLQSIPSLIIYSSCMINGELVYSYITPSSFMIDNLLLTLAIESVHLSTSHDKTISKNSLVLMFCIMYGSIKTHTLFSFNDILYVNQKFWNLIV